MRQKKFVHLRVHSSYSLLEGAIVIPKLIARCVQERMPAIALTDSSNLFGALEFSMTASKNGVQPIIGGIFKFDPGQEYRFLVGGVTQFDEVLLIAKNQEGYRNLLRLASSYYLNHKRGEEHITFSQLKEMREGLIVFTAGVKGTVGRLVLSNREKEAEEFIQILSSAFKDHLYVELMRHGLEEEQVTEKVFLKFGLKYNIPFVATNDVCFLTPDMHKAHEVLLCVSDGKYIHDETRRKSTPEHSFKSSEEMDALFSDIPEAVANTGVIARRCSVKAEEREMAFPNYKTTKAKTPEEELRIVAEEGLCARFEVMHEDESTKKKKWKVYLDRLNYELSIIIKMNFASYLLIVADFVKWSKENEIPVGPGRGSGAGSIVSWCLGITEPDPIKFGLLFERFLNPERVSLPDFDIDFCQDRRDEVIKYVREKYGKERVAHIITFGKLQARAVVRDVGRVLQLPYTKVDRIAKLIPFNAISPVTLSQAIEMEPELQRMQEQNESIADLLDIALKLEGLYRHVSIHAGGIVIADQDLENIVPLYRDEKSDMLVIQYSMKYAEAVGLIKFDFLGLRTLTMIAKCEELIKRTESDFKLDDVEFNDNKTFKMLSKGLSVGMFQLESGKMQDSLNKMRPDSIEDIIALGALNRPGPMNNIASYIECKHGRSDPDYLHPKLEQILSKTFGVLIYQEQVIETAQVLAGYTAGAADLLRRAMGKKIKAEMDAQKEIFIKGSVKRGVTKDHADRVFNLIEKFAGYGFNRSHAVAYGLISYYTAYLKANYTPEFLVAIMNTEINDTDKINLFIQEAKNFKIEVVAPDLNRSESNFSVQKVDGKKVIVYGFSAIKNIGANAMQVLCEERNANGLYKDIFDFVARADATVINKRQLEYLIKAGAFDSLCNNRKQVFDSIDVLVGYYNMLVGVDNAATQIGLFSKESLNVSPKLMDTQDWDQDVRLSNECEAFGFYLLSHPLDVYKEYFEKMNIFGAYQVKTKLTRGTFQVKIAAIPVTMSTKLSKRGKYMLTVMSTPSGILNIAIFDEDLLEKHRNILHAKVPLMLEADVMKDEDIERIVARNICELKDYLQQCKSTVVITVENSKALKHIKNLLEVCDSKERISLTKVILRIVQGDKKIKVELPDNTTCDLSRLSSRKLPKGVMIETVI